MGQLKDHFFHSFIPKPQNLYYRSTQSINTDWIIYVHFIRLRQDDCYDFQTHLWIFSKSTLKRFSSVLLTLFDEVLQECPTQGVLTFFMAATSGSCIPTAFLILSVYLVLLLDYETPR